MCTCGPDEIKITTKATKGDGETGVAGGGGGGIEGQQADLIPPSTKSSPKNEKST